jgi:hypothetical protein
MTLFIFSEFRMTDLMAQNYLCCGDSANGIIAKTGWQFCHPGQRMKPGNIFVL